MHGLLGFLVSFGWGVPSSTSVSEACISSGGGVLRFNNSCG